MAQITRTSRRDPAALIEGRGKSLDQTLSARPRRVAGQAGQPSFRERNLGLKGEPPPERDVPRGHYLDMMV
jgi:hypothetical protein